MYYQHLHLILGLHGEQKPPIRVYHVEILAPIMACASLSTHNPF